MTIHEILKEFSQKKVLVLGDVMIDSYIIGKVNRISPEAPVPIVSLKTEEQRLGGAANVALNLKALGAEAILCSAIGHDKGGNGMLEMMKNMNLSTTGIVMSTNRVTTVKTRVLGNQQHLLRIDSENTHPLNEIEEIQLFEAFEHLLEFNAIDVIILEDYNKGVLTPKIIEKVISKAKELCIPVTVDPKKENFFEYKHVDLFKPNFKELCDGLKIEIDIHNKTKFSEALELLESKLKNKISFVTLSEHGVYIKDQSNEHHINAHLRNIADVSGAGDTVIAVASLCLALNLSIESIAELSNLAGGLVCEKSGVVNIDPDLLIQECEGKNYN
jgi:D-glycero-beta-D-manno-heptose-7-phosphate kinase